ISCVSARGSNVAQARPEHSVFLVLDHARGGGLPDAWVTTKVDKLIEQCRDRAHNDDFAYFDHVELTEARALLDRALPRTEQVVAGGDRSEGPVPEAVGLNVSELTEGP